MHLDKASLSQCQTFLFDIEGTICSIAFVKEVLYPYFVKNLPQYIQTNWSTADLQNLLTRLPSNVEHTQSAVQAHFLDLVAKDVKDPVLKDLQGLIWTAGYTSTAITAPLYADVIPAFRTLHTHAKSLAIYSSGSVHAQRLLFGHIGAEHFPSREQGEQSELSDSSPSQTDLNTGLFFTRSSSSASTDPASISIIPAFIPSESTTPRFFDTTNAGPKTESASYETIARSLNVAPSSIAFFTDNIKEAQASRAAGSYTVVLVRPGNAELPAGTEEEFPVVGDLDGVSAIIEGV